MIAWFARNGVAANLLLAVILFVGLHALFNRIPLEVFPDFELDVRSAFGGANNAETRASVADLCSELVRKVVDLGIARAGDELPPEVVAILQRDLSLDSLRASVEQRLEEEADDLLEDAAKKLDEKLGKKLEGLFGE